MPTTARPVGAVNNILGTQNLVAGTAEIQSGAGEYSFSTKRAAEAAYWSGGITRPNAPDATAAEVFGNEPGHSAGIAPSPWTFAGESPDNFFLIGDFTDQYGPAGMNTLSDQHLTMLTSFATAVSKGTVDFGGGMGFQISRFMKHHATSHAATSTLNKETDGMGVPVSSGGASKGFSPESQYGNGPSGDPSEAVLGATAPSMDSAIQGSFADTATSTNDTFVAEDQSQNGPNDGEKVATLGPTGDQENNGPVENVLAQSEGADAMANPQAARSSGLGGHQKLFSQFFSSAAGRTAFMNWMGDQANRGS
jgi:hypothetical protein